MMFKPFAWQEKDDIGDADSLSVQALVISKKAIPAPRDFSTMSNTFDDIPIPGRQHVPWLFHGWKPCEPSPECVSYGHQSETI